MKTLLSALSTLNQAQRQAVEAPSGHVLVSAGAGTGKTRVLTLRYGHLVTRENVAPQAIMAVTFTNKAAQELKNRLRDSFPVYQLWIGTFHSLGLRILRQHAPLINRSQDFNVLDTSDQNSLVQKLLKSKAAKKSYTPRMVMNAISQWKNRLLLPSEVVKAPTPFYLELYHEYHEQMKLMNCLDFDDLLFLSLKVLQNHPEVLSQYAFSHILVDEYQDINETQYLWLKAFSNQGSFLFCVGDDDQSIYGWRGASIDKILKFPNDFPDSTLVCLEDNYRSTPHILSAASQLIAHNEARHGKTLRTHHTSGEKIQVQGLWDSGEEAAFVAENVLSLTRSGESLSSMAILVRTGAQTREFEERFTLQHIPYYLVGSTRFYDRLEIRDFVAYLRVIHSRTDNLAFERIINVPKRGIGPTTLQSLYEIASTQEGSLEQAARTLCENINEGAIKRTLSGFLQLLDTWREHLHTMPLAELADRVLQESGYFAMWQSQGIQGEARLDNLKELVKAIQAFGSLTEFLEHISLLAEVTESSENEGIAMMTLHAAKGLEFDTAFLPGWEEHVFPHIRCIEETGKKGLEEERRLAYVGITRAKKRCYISFCWNRRSHQGFMPSSPSRFINELPPEDINMSLRLNYNTKDVPLAQQKRVMHSVFGQGVVQGQVGHMVSVLFDRYGLKKVIARFLEFI